MSIILIVVLVLLLAGGFGTLPMHSYSAGWGYWPSGAMGLILVILIVLFVMGRL